MELVNLLTEYFSKILVFYSYKKSNRYFGINKKNELVEDAFNNTTLEVSIPSLYNSCLLREMFLFRCGNIMMNMINDTDKNIVFEEKNIYMIMSNISDKKHTTLLLVENNRCISINTCGLSCDCVIRQDKVDIFNKSVIIPCIARYKTINSGVLSVPKFMFCGKIFENKPIPVEFFCDNISIYHAGKFNNIKVDIKNIIIDYLENSLLKEYEEEEDKAHNEIAYIRQFIFYMGL